LSRNLESGELSEERTLCDWPPIIRLGAGGSKLTATQGAVDTGNADRNGTGESP
jgi:hypothetical protein